VKNKIEFLFLKSRWRSALLWRSFFTTAVVAVVVRLFIDLCGTGRCGMFGMGGLIMYDVSTLFDLDDLMTYHLKDIPTVILIGVIGALLGALYNFLMKNVLRFYNIINEYASVQFNQSVDALFLSFRAFPNCHIIRARAGEGVCTSCCWRRPCPS
jgi:H+/Cl- antiporter ClcA